MGGQGRSKTGFVEAKTLRRVFAGLEECDCAEVSH